MRPYLLVFLLYGCATMTRGKQQSVGVSSVPTAARVTVDGQVQEPTPVGLQLARKQAHTIRVEYPNHRDTTFMVTRHSSGSGWTAALLGNFWNLWIGTFFDIANGAVFDLRPARTSVFLTPTPRDSVK